MSGPLRHRLPLVAGFAALIVAGYVGPLAAWLLIMLGFGLVLDGATVMWARAGSTGNLRTHRQ